MSNIVIFSHFKPYPPNHGFAHRVWHLALALKKEDKKVIIIHNAIHGKNKKIVKNMQGIKIIQLPFLFKFMQKKHFIFQANPLFLLELLKLNKKGKIGIVEIELPYMILIALFLRLFGKKLVYDAHGVEYEWHRVMYKKKNIVLFLIKLIETLALRLSNKVICCSKNDRNTFINEFKIKKEKIDVVPSLIDVDNFKKIKPFKFKKKTVLFIGSQLHPANKEAIDIIYNKIIPAVNKKIKNVQFCFIGKDPPHWLKGKNILVLGEIKDVKSYILGSDLCIAPIFKGCGIRIKILEYMAGKKCVIATTKAAEGLDVGQGKNIILKDDIIDFSNAIVYFLRNKNKAKKIGLEGYKLVKKEYDINSLKILFI